MLDMVVSRHELKAALGKVLSILMFPNLDAGMDTNLHTAEKTKTVRNAKLESSDKSTASESTTKRAKSEQ
jgi:hypothetical protein